MTDTLENHFIFFAIILSIILIHRQLIILRYAQFFIIKNDRNNLITKY